MYGTKIDGLNKVAEVDLSGALGNGTADGIDAKAKESPNFRFYALYVGTFWSRAVEARPKARLTA